MSQSTLSTTPSRHFRLRMAAVLYFGARLSLLALLVAAPLAGFIRRNAGHQPMHLYFGGRDPAQDFYFGPEVQRWLGEGRLATLQAVFSRVPDGGGYVQDALRRDAAHQKLGAGGGAGGLLTVSCLDVLPLLAGFVHA